MSLFAPDAWLTETLARPVFKWTGELGELREGRLSAEMAERAEGGDTFFFAKLPTSDVAQSMILARVGFSVVDTAITFNWAGEDRGTLPSGVAVGLARPEQHQAVADIATRCFRWSRFHLDPQIPTELANLVKRRWIESYCLGRRGSALYAAEVDGATVGFLAVLESAVLGRSVASIDLVGVASEHQGRGVGAALVRRFVDEWRGRVSELRVGTQAANIRSIRFYERIGFRAVESTYVLHVHYRHGKIPR